MATRRHPDENNRVTRKNLPTIFHLQGSTHARTRSRADVSPSSIDDKAGGKGNISHLESEYIEKTTQQTEGEFYLRLFMKSGGAIDDDIQPGHPEIFSELESVDPRLLSIFPKIQSVKKIGSGTYEVEMENIAYGLTQNRSNIYDIKIGAEIVYREELLKNVDIDVQKKGLGSKWVLKTINTRYLSHMRGTKTRGYEYIPQTKHKTKRYFYGLTTDHILGKHWRRMNTQQREKLLDKLRTIRNYAYNLPVSFVGASVLVVIPDDENKEPAAKIIDLEHAIGCSRDQDLFQTLKNNFINGMDSLIHTAQNILRDQCVSVEAVLS